MKKIILSIAVLAIALPSFAQWTSGPGNINNTNTGNVGVGTTNPYLKFQVVNPGLQVKGSAYINSAFIREDINNYSGIFLGYDSSGQIGIIGANSAGAPSTLAFWTLTSSTQWGEKMRLDNNGNLGIGTTAPSEKLNVIGGNILTDSWYCSQSNAGTTSPILGVNRTNNAVFFGDLFGNLNQGLYLRTSGADRLIIDATGNIGIGTASLPTYKLAVNGNVVATSVTVKPYNNWPDYVFKKNYQLPSLSEVKKYIDNYSHLPDMPAAQEIEDKGINLGDIVTTQTKKIEELTLYMIELQKQNKATQQQNTELRKELIKTKRRNHLK